MRSGVVASPVIGKLVVDLVDVVDVVTPLPGVD